MSAAFYLLGAFEVETGGVRSPIGDTLAAKMLAYLAFRNRFCSHDEIAFAVWGKPKEVKGGKPGVSSKGKVDDDAYQRQVSNLRALLTDLGLPPQDYVLIQPNGLQLHDGAFTTDVSRFDECLRLGLNVSLTADVRLEALQEAERLRRGYFLDGMHCEWIIAQDRGARADYAAKFQAIRQEIDALRRAQDRAQSGGRVPFHDGFYQALPTLRQSIGDASQEIIFYGIDFRVTIPVILDLLQDKLRAGVHVKFLMLDCEAMAMAGLAAMIDDSETTLRNECRVALHRLETLAKQFGGLVEIATYDGFIPGRMYGIDT